MYRKLKGARTRYRWVRRFRKRKIRRFERGLSLIKLRKNLKAQIKLIRVNLKLFKSKTEKKKMQGILAEKILKKKKDRNTIH
jgi:hypothetical protein